MKVSQIMSDSAQGMVDCERHRHQPPTYVCRHLVKRLSSVMSVGFFTLGDTKAERADAWRSACEEAALETGSIWTDKSEEFSGIRMICAVCYDNAKAQNEKKWLIIFTLL